MALTIILICLVAVNILNVMLVCDLYNRNQTLAKLAHNHAMHIRSLLHKVAARTEDATPAE